MNTKSMTKERMEEIEESGMYDAGAFRAYVYLIGMEYATLEAFEEAYMGEWSDDIAFVQRLLEEDGTAQDCIDDLPSYIHIDWESTARDIMYDYDEENGYYFRKL